MKTTTQHLHWTRKLMRGSFTIALFMATIGVAVAGPRHPRVRQVNARFENQQDRIAAGVKSGQLTAKETATLERKEAGLKNEENFFRLENNGHLTKGEQLQLNKQENQLSKEIYNQKHDAQVQNENPKSEIGKRLENQQDRIAQGIDSGQLTAGEAARLEAREVGVRNEIATDRNANGGKLTTADKIDINKDLNGLSGRIYNEKHDAQTQGTASLSVNQRFENQQDRIAAGVKSGQLTAGETASLETKEAALKNEEQIFRLENNGKLTSGERALLNKQENKLSAQIYNQKHDAQVQNENPKSEVGKRLENQQDRIAQGINSGQLTAGEAARLEAREVELRHEISTDRNANGGKLTDAEKVEINKELDGLSTRIYNQKHDAQTQPH